MHQTKSTGSVESTVVLKQGVNTRWLNKARALHQGVTTTRHIDVAIEPKTQVRSLTKHTTQQSQVIAVSFKPSVKAKIAFYADCQLAAYKMVCWRLDSTTVKELSSAAVSAVSTICT